jgi:hypothetical protein
MSATAAALVASSFRQIAVLSTITSTYLKEPSLPCLI